MKYSPPFGRAPLYVTLKLMAFTPVLLVGHSATAEVIRYDTIIDSSKPTTNYRVINGATLTANGASTETIKVERDSAVQLNGSTVNGAVSGVELYNARASIVGSTVNASGTGLSLGRIAGDPGGSSAVVQDSTINGGRTGVDVGELSTLEAVNTHIRGGERGLHLANGQATLRGGSISGGIGVMINPGADLTQPNKLVLDNVMVEGTSGPALHVGDYGLPSSAAEIEVNNGTTLTGANGVLLEVVSGATANMSVNNSHLSGDVQVEQGAEANLVLRNAASLTGNLYNVTSLALDSGGQWTLAGDNQLAKLGMNGGTVNFGQPGDFHTLTLGELSGSGTFAMKADFLNGLHDFLDVTGQASGSHQLAVTASGQDPLKNTNLHMVHIAGGDAEFSLVGGPVDLGTWSYDLLRQGNDWYLDAASRTISPGTGSVLALFNAAPTVWYGELSSLRTRMGELRMDRGNAGGWMRAYGSQYDVEQSAGVAYRQSMKGLSLGADAPLPYGDGQWLVGVMAGYSDSDLDLRRGTRGNVDSFYVGGYGTWLDEASGYYLDAVIKFNHLRNKADVAMSDGQRASGRYSNNGMGASLEFGRHIKLDDGYFVEPFGQLSALTVSGKDYHLSNGMRAEGERTGSLLGKLGATAGRNFDVGQGRVLQPYLRAALVHEFADDNEVRVNDNRFNNDLSGSRLELGAGVAMSLTDRWQVHADFDHSNGKRVEQPWGANFGVRYSW